MNTNERDLVLNPYARLEASTESPDECMIWVPRPGLGLCSLSIKLSEYPRLFDLLREVSELSFNTLDVKNDFDENERDLLLVNGILIEKGSAPLETLFACMLSDVSPTE